VEPEAGLVVPDRHRQYIRPFSRLKEGGKAGRQEGRKEERKKGGKAGRKEGRKEGT
jgi:hypothetical protein